MTVGLESSAAEKEMVADEVENQITTPGNAHAMQHVRKTRDICTRARPLECVLRTQASASRTAPTLQSSVRAASAGFSTKASAPRFRVSVMSRAGC
jgi:hypothetical protein